MTTKSKTTKTAPALKPTRPAPTPKKTKAGAKLVMNLTTGAITVKKVKAAAKIVDPRIAAKRAQRFPQETAKAAAPRKAKPAKVVRPVVPFIARTVAKGQPVHVIAPDARPSVGAALYAHTHAALHALGMMADKRPNASERALVTIMGGRAVAHHLKENNLVAGKNGTIALTPAGLGKFRARTIDGTLANGFMELFISGKTTPALGVPKAKVFVATL